MRLDCIIRMAAYGVEIFWYMPGRYQRILWNLAVVDQLSHSAFFHKGYTWVRISNDYSRK